MSVSVDTSHFNAYCRDIARMSGTMLRTVVRAEVAKVLEECVRLTTRENIDKIRRSVENKNRTLREGGKGLGPPLIYVTKKGVVWFADEPGPGNMGIAKGRTSHGKTFHPMTEHFRYSDARWAKYQGFMADLKARQIVVRDVIARGGQSWVQCGRAIGMDIAAPGYVKNAPPFRGHAHVNGTGRESYTANGIFLQIENAAPILLGTIDGNRILQRAINGRAKQFQTNLRKGVFDNVSERARLYPASFSIR